MPILCRDDIPLDTSFATIILSGQKLKNILSVIPENFAKDINVLSKIRQLAIYVFCF